MKQEYKELLLKDLCGRLPYGIIGLYTWKNKRSYDKKLTGNLYDELKSSWNSTEDSQFLPYLRPMSSMTEDEEIEYDATFVTIKMSDEHYDSTMTYKSFDWLNAHHFDYRGLIEKGLAIEAPNDMYL